MSPTSETLKPLTIDPETNAEAILNLQQVCYSLSELIADLARAHYANCRKLGDDSGMKKYQRIGEAAIDLSIRLAED